MNMTGLVREVQEWCRAARRDPGLHKRTMDTVYKACAPRELWGDQSPEKPKNTPRKMYLLGKYASRYLEKKYGALLGISGLYCGGYTDYSMLDFCRDRMREKGFTMMVLREAIDEFMAERLKAVPLPNKYCCAFWVPL